MSKVIKLDRKYYLRGFIAGLRWIINPVSEGGASQVSKIRIYLNGPTILDEVSAMRAHPVGRKLLQDKPDLGESTRQENLVGMPEGSFGHTYYNMMNHPDTLPGYLLAGLAYKDGFLDSVEMDEDTHWYMDRQMFEHDASHVLSGYGTDLAGEALNILFILGQMTDYSKLRAFLSPFGIFSLVLRPKIGYRRWFKYLNEAFDRGRSAAEHFPKHSYPYEELLPKPLAEVRSYLGISELPEGFDTSDWFEHSAFARAVTKGFGAMEASKEKSRLSIAVIESGMPWREFMRASEAEQNRLRDKVKEEFVSEEGTAVGVRS